MKQEPTMSQTNYYVRLGMQLMGPFSLDQLRVLKDRGRLQPFHSISTDGRTWQPASTLTELFPPEPSPASANPAPSVAPGAPAAVGPEQDTWYYLDANGQQAGPVSGWKLLELYQSGAIRRDTFVWKPGLDQWKPLEHVYPLPSPTLQTTVRTQLGVSAPDLARWSLSALRIVMMLEVGLTVFAPLFIILQLESSPQELLLNLLRNEIPAEIAGLRWFLFTLFVMVLMALAVLAIEGISVLGLAFASTKRDTGARSAGMAGSIVLMVGLLGMIMALVFLILELPATFIYTAFVARLVLSAGWFLVLLFLRLLAQDAGANALKSEFGYQMLMYAIASAAVLVAGLIIEASQDVGATLVKLLSIAGGIAWLAVNIWTVVCLYRLPRFLGLSAQR
jgi:hypothetical protein